MQNEGQTLYSLVRRDVGRVDFDADALPNQIDGENKARMGPLPYEAAHNTFQRAVLDLDHHAFSNERAWVELQIAFDQTADPVDFMVGDGGGSPLERYDVDDAAAFQYRERVLFFESREAIAGKQGPVDLLFTIFPAAPAGDGGKERVEMLSLDLVAHNLLVARTGPDGKPR